MEHFLVMYLLGFARCYGFIQALPQIGEMEFPLACRMTLVACIVPFVGIDLFNGSPLNAPHLDGALLLLVAKELLLGLFLGFLVGLPLRLPQALADLIDNQRGQAQNSQFNPALGEEAGILGQLLTISLITYFFTEGGFETIIGILAGSFQIQPATSYGFEFGENVWTVGIFVIKQYMHFLAILALPFIAVMLLIDVGFGASSRFATSMNVSFLNQPVKSWMALAVLLPAHPKIFSYCMALFEKVTEVVS